MDPPPYGPAPAGSSSRNIASSRVPSFISTLLSFLPFVHQTLRPGAPAQAEARPQPNSRPRQSAEMPIDVAEAGDV